MRRFFASFALLVLPALLACSSSPSAPDGGLPFTTLVATKVTGSAGPQIQTVVRDEAAWRQVWSDLWSAQEPARPPVDFSRDMVVLVTASGSCFGAAEVEEITVDGGGLLIRYSDAAPTLCLCVVAELAFHAVRAPRVLGEARFEARQTPPLCPTSAAS